MTFSANSFVFIDSNRRLTANTFGTMSANSYIEVLTVFPGGSISGYTSAGVMTPSPTITYFNIIDKFPFATNANAADVGDLTVSRSNVAGQSSTVSGYTSGGVSPDQSNVIDKFPFATAANATDVGDLTGLRSYATGQSSTVSGYTSSGSVPAFPPANAYSNTIDKFPFASNGNATDVGDLTIGRFAAAGQSSSISGYTSGGYNNPGPAGIWNNTIDKFPFSTDANATDVGDLTTTAVGTTGQSSSSSGYNSGGARPSAPGQLNVIDKFPFASDSNASDVGDLTAAPTQYAAGQSSTTFGYTSGGGGIPGNVIDKFPFASNGNATDVGDLTVARTAPAGQQV